MCLCVSRPRMPIISTVGHNKNLLLYFIMVSSQALFLSFCKRTPFSRQQQEVNHTLIEMTLTDAMNAKRGGCHCYHARIVWGYQQSSLCKDVLGFLRCFQAVANLMPQSAQIACSCVECQICVDDVLLILLSFSLSLFMHCLMWKQSDQVSVFKSFSLFPAGPTSPSCVIYSSQLILIQWCAAFAFVSF